MTYAGIQMFMEKLKQLINCNDNPSINNPAIIRERPQFQLLHEELASVIQTFSIYKHRDPHELEKINDLKKRFTDAVEGAQYIVDLFLSSIYITDSGLFPTSEDFNLSLKLDDVRRSFKSVEGELLSIKIDTMEMNSSQGPERTVNQTPAVSSSFTRNSHRSKKVSNEFVVGIDDDVKLIKDKLMENEKNLDVISIVGMGGIGKTTLATEVYNDGYVKHHFHVRVWVTVSQTYDKRQVLIQIMESIRDQLDLEGATYSQLRDMVHKHLMSNRYLIVLDDIWHKETWDSVRLFFPNDNNGSRILLTSRQVEVAKYVNSDGLIHELNYFTRERSWKLLCQKVFRGNEVPEWCTEPGMHIVECCQGLPLALVVIAGVLAKEAWSEEFWVEIAYKAGSYIVGDQNGFMEILSLSYNHLPLHLKECFLYFGGFPEGYLFDVQRLIWIWVAEGFMQQDGDRSLEDIAEGYLMDLIDRNLVIVAHRSKSNGDVKICIVHDLVREVCLKIAEQEQFMVKANGLITVIVNRNETVQSAFINVTAARSYTQARFFIHREIEIRGVPCLTKENLRSILCFTELRPLSDDIAKYICSFVLLRVVDLQKCMLSEFPLGIELLVHLRYLAVWNSSPDFPSQICKLWSLQTLIYITNEGCIVLPSKFSDLVNLRHLWSSWPPMKEMKVVKNSMPFFLPSNEKPMHLQTISNALMGNGVNAFLENFPCIKEATCVAYLHAENDYKSLKSLEKLNLSAGWRGGESKCLRNPITFPETLKTLTLGECRLPWSAMLIIQSLPNLEVLKLRFHAFEGSCWITDEQKFQKLIYLKLEVLDIKKWEADSESFPCLKQLEIIGCNDFEKIPLEFGEIPTLELIRIKDCSNSVGESAKTIQEMQEDYGNYELKIEVSSSPQ